MRLISLLCMLCLMFGCARAEGLPQCTAVAEIALWVTFPTTDEAGHVSSGEATRGFIRYMAQHDIDPLFCQAAWLGGEPGSDMDLTRTHNKEGTPYVYSANTMCTRAVYSMALSYLGIDVTPGDISRITSLRDVPSPYDQVTLSLGCVERVVLVGNEFDRMWDAYQQSETCSPIFLHFDKPEGGYHAFLVVAQAEDGSFIVVDPAFHAADALHDHIYSVFISKDRSTLVYCEAHPDLNGSVIDDVCQWRLTADP